MPALDIDERLADFEASLVNLHRAYYRLALIVGPAGAGKTTLLRALCKRGELPLLNVNLEISQRLLEHPRADRLRLVPQFLSDIIREAGGQTVLLDNCELLFDATLRLNPLQMLQSLSRNCTLIVGWLGNYSSGILTYAAPGHPEERTYSLSPQDAVIISLA